MMNICSSNLIPIFITILCCGAIFIYFNSRLGEIKTSVEKQNRVLTSFITSIQADIRGGMAAAPTHSGVGVGVGVNSSATNVKHCNLTDPLEINANNLASFEALNAVKNIEREKIVVSDDEDTDSEDDSDSEEDTDSEEGDDDLKTEIVKVIKLQDSNDNGNETLTATFEVLSDILSVNENVLDISVLDVSALDLDVSTFDTSMVDVSVFSASTSEDTNYEQMPVNDLRKLVSERNLATKEEVKKLKKPELLVLIKNSV